MQASHRKCFSAHGVLFPPSDAVTHRSLLLLAQFSPSAHKGSTPLDRDRPGCSSSLLFRQLEIATRSRSVRNVRLGFFFFDLRLNHIGVLAAANA